MLQYIRTYKKILSIITITILVLAYVTYNLVSPQGLLNGLSNDLKEIDSHEAALYTDLEGNPTSLLAYKGTPLIINAWASWIPFSESELKNLAEIKARYGDLVHIIAINRMEHIATINAYLGYIGKPDGIVFFADPTDNFYKVIGGYAMPETVFYDKDGVIIKHIRGVLNKEDLMETVDSIVNIR